MWPYPASNSSSVLWRARLWTIATSTLPFGLPRPPPIVPISSVSRSRNSFSRWVHCSSSGLRWTSTSVERPLCAISQAAITVLPMPGGALSTPSSWESIAGTACSWRAVNSPVNRVCSGAPSARSSKSSKATPRPASRSSSGSRHPRGSTRKRAVCSKHAITRGVRAVDIRIAWSSRNLGLENAASRRMASSSTGGTLSRHTYRR